MRVLQVFGKLDRGGAESMIMSYYREIDRTKIQFDFVVNFQEEGAYEDEIKRLGGNIYRLPRFKGYNIIQFVASWNKFLKTHLGTWDIIHIHNFKIAGIVFPIAKNIGVTRRIVHMHIANAKYSFARKMGYYLTKFLANRFSTDKLACSMDAGKAYFFDDNFIVMNNAIDIKKFIFDTQIRNYKREELNITDNFVIGHVGRLTNQKNHIFILDIFKELWLKCKSAKLILIGIGELEPELKSRVEELGLNESVMFLGSRSDVDELMQAMDIFLFPSLYEGLGIVAIEAQAAGLQTFISDTLPNAVMITNLAHEIPLKESAKIWADEILKHNNNYLRQSMLKQVREAGYEVSDNIKWLESFYLNEK